jgi:hypothetical protein
MKLLLTILLLLVCVSLNAQKATISLSNGQFINNAPSGRDWYDYKVSGITTYEGGDTLVLSNLTDQNRVSYYGKWARGKAGVGCECSFSNTANDSLVIWFTDAKSFIWYGELMLHHGIVNVYLNNNLLGEIDTYDSRNLAKTRNWERHDLDPLKVYKFKLVVTGRKNPLSTGAYIVTHGFKMWKDKPVVEPPIVVDPPVQIDTVYVRDTIRIHTRDTVYFVPEIIINYKSPK